VSAVPTPTPKAITTTTATTTTTTDMSSYDAGLAHGFDTLAIHEGHKGTYNSYA
jgi:hypothetical protein